MPRARIIARCVNIFRYTIIVSILLNLHLKSGFGIMLGRNDFSWHNGYEMQLPATLMSGMSTARHVVSPGVCCLYLLIFNILLF
jgi:hypothetical protein